jgi:hypothetical protein
MPCWRNWVYIPRGKQRSQCEVSGRPCRKLGLSIVKSDITRGGPVENSQAVDHVAICGWFPEVMVLGAASGPLEAGAISFPSSAPSLRQVCCLQAHLMEDFMCFSKQSFLIQPISPVSVSSPPPQHVLSVNLFSLKSARSNLLVFKEESAWCILHPALWVCKSVGFSSYLPATCEL